MQNKHVDQTNNSIFEAKSRMGNSHQHTVTEPVITVQNIEEVKLYPVDGPLPFLEAYPDLLQQLSLLQHCE